MRFFKLSFLSVCVLIATPVFSNARLPIVNLSAGSVSARAAFGEQLPLSLESIVSENSKTPIVFESVATKTAPKALPVKSDEARIAVRRTPNSVSVSNSDILLPRRPSADIWAKAEKPLRLPSPSEFTVMGGSDYLLPEESLDTQYFASANTYMPSPSLEQDFSEPIAKRQVFNQGASGLDQEIQRLTQLQNRADETNRTNQLAMHRPSNISSYDMPDVSKPIVQARQAQQVQATPQTNVRRVIVPIEESKDVVVREVQRSADSVIAKNSDDFSRLSPGELKKAFKRTYLSENKHLSTYKIDDRFDVVSDFTQEGFTSSNDLSEQGGVRPLEIKIGFRGEDSALSRDNYNLLSEYASIVVSNPKRAIQVSIPQRATNTSDGRKLAARRLAIVEQVLRDTGVSDQRIMPVLSQRNDDSFILRVISSDVYETMTQKKRDMFGDTVGRKTYKSMTW